MKPKSLLSFREAAKMLGVDRNTTLKDMIRLGDLKTVKAGNRRRIPIAEIVRLARGSDGWDLKV